VGITRALSRLMAIRIPRTRFHSSRLMIVEDIKYYTLDHFFETRVEYVIRENIITVLPN